MKGPERYEGTREVALYFHDKTKRPRIIRVRGREHPPKVVLWKFKAFILNEDPMDIENDAEVWATYTEATAAWVWE